MSDFANPVVDIEAVFNTEFDQDEMNAVAEAALLPKGEYITVTPLTVNEPKLRTAKQYGRLVDGKFEQLDEPIEVERMITTLTGQAVSPDGTHQGKVRVELSAQTILTVSQKGVFGPDRITKMTKSARALYKTANGENPPNLGALVDFIKTTPVTLFVIVMEASGDFEPSNLVCSISRVK